jgi:hypothetical protein
MPNKNKNNAKSHEHGADSHKTVDHDEIRKWVEKRGGHPSTVKRTMKNHEPGLLRIDFPGYSGEGTLEEITWEDFFEKFDKEELAFLYQNETKDGKESRFCKLIAR